MMPSIHSSKIIYPTLIFTINTFTERIIKDIQSLSQKEWHFNQQSIPNSLSNKSLNSNRS